MQYDNFLLSLLRFAVVTGKHLHIPVVRPPREIEKNLA